MRPSRPRLFGGDGHKYTLLGSQNGGSAIDAGLERKKHSVLLIMLITLAGLAIVLISGYVASRGHDSITNCANYQYSTQGVSSSSDSLCGTVDNWLLCCTRISHFWGESRVRVA